MLKIKEICIEMDHYEEETCVYRKGFYIEFPRDKEEKMLNKKIELCVERLIAEHIKLNGWKLSDIPYKSKKETIIDFFNIEKKQELTFNVISEGSYGMYAVPIKYKKISKGCVKEIMVNTIKDAMIS